MDAVKNDVKRLVKVELAAAKQEVSDVCKQP